MEEVGCTVSVGMVVTLVAGRVAFEVATDLGITVGTLVLVAFEVATDVGITVGTTVAFDVATNVGVTVVAGTVVFVGPVTGVGVGVLVTFVAGTTVADFDEKIGSGMSSLV